MEYFKKLKCKLNLHDFEIVHRENKEKIISKIEEEIFSNTDLKKKYSPEVLLQMVCLNCGKKIDQINDFKKNYIQDRIDKTKRQRDALDLFFTK
jgi:hypothetical protein